MFSRRVPKTRVKKMRELLWPSMGIFRLMHYYRHRIGRLPGTPQFVAAGFATGAVLSFTPFIGFHILMGLALCVFFRFSVVAMIIGSVVSGNPWTYPFIWIGTYEIGEWFLGKNVPLTDIPGQFTWAHLMKKPAELLLPMMIGAVPFMLAFWPLCFHIARKLVSGYRKAGSLRKKT